MRNTPFGREGSEGSKGSEGSEGGGGRLENKKGAIFDKTIQPPCRARKTGKPRLGRVGNAPLSPPAAVLPPMGEVLATLPLALV